MIHPRATMRLQFHSGFTFDDAIATLDYMARLGISHVYASPILTARRGSTHGYDVVDPTRVSDALGGRDGLERLVAALRRHDMGLIVDIVPNHMAVGPENPWWLDVLEKGEASPHARVFDIDWRSPDPRLKGKVHAPSLAAITTRRWPMATSGWITTATPAGSSSMFTATAFPSGPRITTC
ncbi:alpha-amylase family glycosyl hydrolase [Tistrella bauzanensis]